MRRVCNQHLVIAWFFRRLERLRTAREALEVGPHVESNHEESVRGEELRDLGTQVHPAAIAARHNHRVAGLAAAVQMDCLRMSAQCDGVHCDIPVLVLPGVFEQTWGIDCKPFWPKAIQRVKEFNPEFRFMSEVYWDKEGIILQQQGFDYTYLTSEDMIVGGRLSKTSEITFVERSVIVDKANLKDLKTILINYLVPRADAC